jgi:hypothetical protein
MNHLATVISDVAVHIRFAEQGKNSEAEYCIDILVPRNRLTLPSPDPEPTLGEPEIRFLREIKLAALHYARDVIDEEAQRLANPRDRF